jgi:hypothetical protein
MHLVERGDFAQPATSTAQIIESSVQISVFIKDGADYGDFQCCYAPGVCKPDSVRQLRLLASPIEFQ